jgi:ADP-ribose pyrophosphatase
MSDTNFLSDKTVFQSKFFRVRQVEVEKRGKIISKDIIERNDSIFILALTEGNEIYLVSQFRDALQKETLEIVAGTLDSGEEPLETAKRELAEEAGLTAKIWKQVAKLNVSANMMSKCHIFVARDLTQGTQHQDDDEDITVVKMPFQEAVEKAYNGEIDINSNISALLLVDHMMKEGKL